MQQAINTDTPLFRFFHLCIWCNDDWRDTAGDVAFTIKEARELSRMTDCYAHIATEDVTFTEEEQAHLDSKRPRKRLTALLQKIATEEYNGQPRRWDLEFKQG